MFKKFLADKLPGFYVACFSFVFALLSLIIYVARGGNYLSPVSPVAVTLLAIGLVFNLISLIADFKMLPFIPVVLYACSIAVLLNTEMLFISNVAFGVDGNSLDIAFFLFWIFDVLAVITSAVAFSMGLSKSGKLVLKD